MNNALVGVYNVGLSWLSPEVARRHTEFYRDETIRDVFNRTTGIGPPTIADRYNEKKFVFNHNCSWLPDVKFEYKKVGTFEEVCLESAQLLANTGKTIDFHWSGGIDSTTALVALNEICPKQLHVICNKYSIAEYPDYYDKVVKYLDHTVDDKDNVLGVGNPQKNIWSQATEADTLMGGCMIKHGRNKPGMTPEELAEAEYEWKLKFRYALGVRGWRTLLNFDGDWLDIDNWRPFYTSTVMQQYCVNKLITGEIYWYSNFLFGKDMPDYVNAKREFRDFVCKYTNDKEYPYTKLKYASLKPGQKSIREGSPLITKHDRPAYLSKDKREEILANDSMPKVWGFTDTGIVINKRTCKDLNIDDYLNPEREYLYDC